MTDATFVVVLYFNLSEILIVSKFNLNFDRYFNIPREKHLVKDSNRMRNYILNFDSYFFIKMRNARIKF